MTWYIFGNFDIRLQKLLKIHQKRVLSGRELIGSRFRQIIDSLLGLQKLTDKFITDFGILEVLNFPVHFDELSLLRQIELQNILQNLIAFNLIKFIDIEQMIVTNQLLNSFPIPFAIIITVLAYPRLLHQLLEIILIAFNLTLLFQVLYAFLIQLVPW